jgi:hypothetical protein
VFELVEDVVGDFAFFDDALAKAGAVAEDDELHLAAGTRLIYPAG